MTSIKQVLDKKGRGVHSIGPDETVFDALKVMADRDIGSLVVLENGRLVGIVTERHYAREIVLKGKTSPTTRVQDIMSRKVVCARPEQSVEEGMAVMTTRTVRHLPVLEGRQVVGLVSIGDMVRSLIDEQKFIIEELEHYIHGHRR